MSARGLALLSSPRWRAALLVIACLFAFLPGISTLPPVDRDESRFVQATKQMLETGDYVDIRFQDEHRYKKPVGIYWLQSAAVKLTGQGPEASVAAYRLVSAAAATLAVVMIADIGAFLFGPAAGLAAGAMLLGLLGLGLEARLAKTDATLLAITLVAQAALARLHVGARREQQAGQGWWWTFWLAIGAGLLVKGPVTPAVSALTVAAITLFDKDRAWLRALKPGRGLALALLLVLPWFLAITWRSGGAFWQEAVGKDLVGKIASGQESHGAPPGYYVLTYSLFMWPFGLAAILGGLKALNRFREPALLFCLGWYIPFWLVLEATPTKLPHYVLPAYPGLILLGAWGLFAVDGQGASLLRWQRWLAGLTAFGLALVTLALAAGAIALPIALAGQFLWVSLPAAALALAAGWLASGWRTEPFGAARLPLAAAASALFAGLVTGGLLPAVKPLWLSPMIAAAFDAARPCPDAQPVSVGYHEPSLVFLAGTDILMTDAAGAAEALSRPGGCVVAAIPMDQLPALEHQLADGVSIETTATVTGVNYSKGRQMQLAIIRPKR